MMFRTGDFPQIGPMIVNPSTNEEPPHATPCFSGLNGSYVAKRNSRKSKLLYSEIDKLYLRHRQQHPHRRLSNLNSNRRPKLMPQSARRFPRSQGILPPHLLSSNNAYQRLKYSYMQANELPQRREFHPMHSYSCNGTKLGCQLSGHLYRANDHDDAHMAQHFVPANRSGKVYANEKCNLDCNLYQDMAATNEVDHSFDHVQEFEMQSELISNFAPEVRVMSEKLQASENISVVTVDSGKCSTLSSNNTISLRSEPGLSEKAKESIVTTPTQVTETTSGKMNSFSHRNDARKAWPVITFGNGRPGSSVFDYHLLIVTKKDYDTSSLVTDVMTSNHVYTVHPLEKPEVLYNALQENLEVIAREFAKVIPHNPELDPRVSVEFISFDEQAREGPYLLLVGILNVEEPIAKEKVGSFVVILRGSTKGAKGIIKAINGDQVFVVMNHRGMSMKRWITRSNVKVLDELKILQHFENTLLRAKDFATGNENESSDGQDNNLNTSTYRKDRQGMKGLDLLSKRSWRKFPGHTRVASQGIDADNDEISCDSFLYLYELTHEDKELRPLSSRDFDGKIASFMSKESSCHGSQREMADNPKEDHTDLNHEAEHYVSNQSTRNAKRHEEYDSISKPRPMESHVVIETLSQPMESNVTIETQSHQLESNVMIETPSHQMESNVMIEDDSKKEDHLFEMLPPLSHARDEMDVELLRMEYQGNCDEDRQRLQIGQQLLASPSSVRFQVEKDLDHKATTYDKSFSSEATFFSSHRNQADCFPKLISSAFANSRRSKSSNGIQRLADELSCPTHRKLRYTPAIALGKRDTLVEMSEGSKKQSNAFLLGDIQYDYPVEKNGVVPVNHPEEKHHPERTTTTHEACSFLPPKPKALTYAQRRFNKFTSVSKALGRKRKLPLSSNRMTPPIYERRIETTTFDAIPIGSYSI
jgi:hypothetical protein